MWNAFQRDYKARVQLKEKQIRNSHIAVHHLSSVFGALVDKITVNTDMANLSTAVSIRSFNPGPDR